MPLPLAVAVSVFTPSWTVQLPTVATPSLPVVAFAPVTLPPPLDTAKVTATLGTGKLPASRTTTAGAKLRAYPMSPVWPSPGPADTLAGAPGCTAVAGNGTGMPVTPEPATAPVSGFCPPPAPSVPRPPVAAPFAAVWVAAPATVPAPAVAADAGVNPGT